MWVRLAAHSYAALCNASLVDMCSTRGTVLGVPDDTAVRPSAIWDDLTQRWNMLSPARRHTLVRRPLAAVLPAGTTPCPFCPGNEAETEIQLDAMRLDDTAWQARSVANKYPIYGSAHDAVPDHEVVVLGRGHDEDISAMSIEQSEVAIALILRRLAAGLGREAPDAMTVGFLNHGALAGASQPHPHAQVLALPMVTNTLATEQAACRVNCPLCADVAALHNSDASSAGRGPASDRQVTSSHKVAQRNSWYAWCPPSSAFSFEMRLASSVHQCSPGATPAELPSNTELTDIAGLVRDCLRALMHVFGASAYNVVFHARAHGRLHWHMHILPRLTNTSPGFEFGAAVGVAMTAPSDAAEQLRAALRDLDTSHLT